MLSGLLVILSLSPWLAKGFTADQAPPPLPTADPRPGLYRHELHGANGWYIPDNSGKYRHEHKPYDGGYGDRGPQYANDLRGIFRKAEEQLAASVRDANENFALGPRDHLRFMIDFNYNGTGWQIIQFEWVRDGDENNEDQRQYSYVNENRLWEMDSTHLPETVHTYQYEEPQAAVADESDCKSEQQPSELDKPLHTQNQGRINSEHDPKELQSTINEVLEYIQQHILPNLN